jgi:hypothetical protein
VIVLVKHALLLPWKSTGWPELSKMVSKSDTLEAVDEPVLARDQYGNIDYDSLPEVIQWFLDYDQRVAIIKHPKVEELFQWKQEQSRNAGEDVFNFNRAEDRLAIGIIQSVAHHSNERELHGWIGQLLNALQEAQQRTEEVSSAYSLDMKDTNSIVAESKKIPASKTRDAFLVDCWLESLCTAEIRVLGWLYREFFGRPFHPENF